LNENMVNNKAVNSASCAWGGGSRGVPSLALFGRARQIQAETQTASLEDLDSCFGRVAAGRVLLGSCARFPDIAKCLGFDDSEGVGHASQIGAGSAGLFGTPGGGSRCRRKRSREWGVGVATSGPTARLALLVLG